MSRPLSSHLSGIRARVVLWYLGLLAMALIVTVLALRQFLLVGLDESVDASLRQEAQELSSLRHGYGSDDRCPLRQRLGSNL